MGKAQPSCPVSESGKPCETQVFRVELVSAQEVDTSLKACFGLAVRKSDLENYLVAYCLDDHILMKK